MSVLKLTLHITLLSDATFARGDGVAGWVDEEIEYERETGLPFIHGRTVKGLLSEEAANLLFSLEQIPNAPSADYYAIAGRLFGGPGVDASESGAMRIGPARVAEPLRSAVVYATSQAKSPNSKIDSRSILESLTEIRRQTAMTENGIPEHGSLRVRRVVLRETPFEASLTLLGDIGPRDKGFLAACVLGLRRGGSARNRGSGRLVAGLHDEKNDVTKDYFQAFVDDLT